jgi:hypothetical protein
MGGGDGPSSGNYGEGGGMDMGNNMNGAGVPAAVRKPGEDPSGMERLMGESKQQYVARQTHLRDEAQAPMAAKFGGGGVVMGGVGGGGHFVLVDLTPMA